MSKEISLAVDAVKHSQFKIYEERGHTKIEVINAVTIWNNFAGNPNKFGSTAKSCNLVLTEEVAGLLTERGWRVRQIDNLDENKQPYGEPMYIVNIKINMSGPRPPMIAIYTDYKGVRSRTVLNDADLHRIGAEIQIESMDMVVNEYASRQFPDKVTGYLDKLYIVQKINEEFGGKYDDWETARAEIQSPTDDDPDDDSIPF